MIGAIDYVHTFPSKSPVDNEKVYVNRKDIQAINVQAVCDATMRLLDVVAKWPDRTRGRLHYSIVAANAPRNILGNILANPAGIDLKLIFNLSY